MQFVLSDSALREYRLLSMPIRSAFDKQADALAKNIRHPSLHAKKYDEATGVWQARVNRGWRFYFLIIDNAYVIIEIRKHPK